MNRDEDDGVLIGDMLIDIGVLTLIGLGRRNDFRVVYVVLK